MWLYALSGPREPFKRDTASLNEQAGFLVSRSLTLPPATFKLEEFIHYVIVLNTSTFLKLVLIALSSYLAPQPKRLRIVHLSIVEQNFRRPLPRCRERVVTSLLIDHYRIILNTVVAFHQCVEEFDGYAISGDVIVIFF